MRESVLKQRHVEHQYETHLCLYEVTDSDLVRRSEPRGSALESAAGIA